MIGLLAPSSFPSTQGYHMSRNSTVASTQIPRRRDEVPTFKTATPSHIILTSASTSTSNSVNIASKLDLSDQHMAEFEAGVRKNFTAAEINYLSYLLRAQRLHQESARQSRAQHGAFAPPNAPATACSGQSSNQPNALYEFPSVFGTVPPPPPQNLKPPYTPDPSSRKRTSHQEEPESPSEAVSPALASRFCSDILFPSNQLANKALKRPKAQSPRHNGVHVSGSSSARQQAPSVENDDSQQYRQQQDPAPNQGRRAARITVVSKSATSAKLPAAAPKTTSTLFISPATPFDRSQSNRSRNAKDNAPSAQLAAAFHARQELYAMLKDSPPACPNAVASTSARSAEFIAPVTPPKASKKVAVPALQHFPAPPEPWASLQQMISPPRRRQVPRSQLYPTQPAQTSASHRPFVSPRIQPHDMPAFASHEFLAGFPTGNPDDPFVAGKGKQKASYSARNAHTPNTSNMSDVGFAKPIASKLGCMYSGKTTKEPVKVSTPRQQPPTLQPSPDDDPCFSTEPLPARGSLTTESASCSSSSGSTSGSPRALSAHQPPNSGNSLSTDFCWSHPEAILTSSPVHSQKRLLRRSPKGVTRDLPPSPFQGPDQSGRVLAPENGTALSSTPKHRQSQASGRLASGSSGSWTSPHIHRQYHNMDVLQLNVGDALPVTPTRQTYRTTNIANAPTISENHPTPQSFIAASAQIPAFLVSPTGRDTHSRDSSLGSMNLLMPTADFSFNHSMMPAANLEVCPPPRSVGRAPQSRNTSSGSSNTTLPTPQQAAISPSMIPDTAWGTCLSPNMGENMMTSPLPQQYQLLPRPSNGPCQTTSNSGAELLPPWHIPAPSSHVAARASLGGNSHGGETSRSDNTSVPIFRHPGNTYNNSTFTGAAREPCPQPNMDAVSLATPARASNQVFAQSANGYSGDMFGFGENLTTLQLHTSAPLQIPVTRVSATHSRVAVFSSNNALPMPYMSADLPDAQQ